MQNPANLLKPHSASHLHGHHPDPDVLTRWVTKGDDASDHWIWLAKKDAPNPRRFNERNQAIVSWRPNTQYRRGIFVVARLFLEHGSSLQPTRSSYTSDCLLPSCVNPSHWRRLVTPSRYRFDASVFGWRVAEVRDGRLLQRRVLLTVVAAGVTHLVEALPAPVHHYVAVCGAAVDPGLARVAPMHSHVTCLGCL